MATILMHFLHETMAAAAVFRPCGPEYPGCSRNAAETEERNDDDPQ
jgi:hypothetical protein